MDNSAIDADIESLNADADDQVVNLVNMYDNEHYSYESEDYDDMLA